MVEALIDRHYVLRAIVVVAVVVVAVLPFLTTEWETALFVGAGGLGGAILGGKHTEVGRRSFHCELTSRQEGSKLVTVVSKKK